MARLLFVALCCLGVACKAAPAPTTPNANQPAPIAAAPLPAAAAKAGDELAVARAWTEALGRSDRKALAALSNFYPLHVLRAEGDGTGCAEDVSDADELVTQAPCLT